MPEARFPVVGVGASAGGLEALEALFAAMPPTPGLAFVVVTHLHRGSTSLLPELLGRASKLAVSQVEEGTPLQPDHVYVGPPGCRLTLQQGVLHRLETQGTSATILPIDSFFRSLAEDRRELAIGIVLSGTGTDGTLGIKAIKGAAGMVMAQQPQSAKYAGMPSSAIATGLVDYVLEPQQMAEQLLAYARGPYLAARPAAAPEPMLAPEEPLNRIFLLLRERTGHDFADYKLSTIRRRVERRMNVHQIRRPAQYVRYLEQNPHEVDILFKELLIGVTNFFRDPQAWEALTPGIEQLIVTHAPGQPLRVWVPGCATGEEAYSLAILLRECMDRLERRLEVQIFGTDLDADAIETARAGQYPDGIAVDVSAARLERFFRRDEGCYRVRKEVREMTIFAQQNVIRDPPFTKLDLLSCRNLLIYLNADLQRRLMPLFHYALRADGLLFLGPSESASAFGDLFDLVDKRWKLFRRKPSTGIGQLLAQLPMKVLTGEPAAAGAAVAAPAARPGSVGSQIERLLLNRFTPASVVATTRGEVVYIHGRTGAYLEPAPGEPRNTLLDMAREGLQVELGSAMRECARRGGRVVREDVRVQHGAETITVDLAVEKIQEPEAARGLLLVTFQPSPARRAAAAAARRARRPAAEGQKTELLERELLHLKESHQTALEELETSNEELKSTNEELQSTNEELQSANEELETSKEELQSLNEELTTVNVELQSKLDDLSQANDDMQNLLNSTEIATVFLDEKLNIKRFTEQAKELVMLRQTDIGRPISELASNLKLEDLAGDCRNVLRTLVFRETEVETRDARHFLMRIMPYRTSENVIDGLVLTFVNIGRPKQTRMLAEQARTYVEGLVATVREPLIVLDRDLTVIAASRPFFRLFQTTAKQTLGEPLPSLYGGCWDRPELRELLQGVLGQHGPLEDVEIEIQVPNLGQRRFVLNARRVEHPPGVANLVLLALEDVSAH